MTDSRAATAAVGSWPVPRDRRVTVCAQASGRVERSLLDEWVARHRLSGDGRVTTVHVPYPKGDDAGPLAAAIGDVVDGDDDLVLLPLRVVWPPRDPSRLPHLLETVVTGDPRHPRPQAQGIVGRLRRDRARVIVADPASIGELRGAWSQLGGADADGFHRFVARRLTLALERAESRVLGPQYKVPRMVREEIGTSARFREGLSRLAERLGRDRGDVAGEAGRYLDEMVAGHSRAQNDFMIYVSRFMYGRGYDRHVDYDPAQVERIRDVMRRFPTVMLPTHRSYLDAMVLPVVLHDLGLPPRHVLAGNNMNFWPIGSITRRAGGVFVRRDAKDAPVYRHVLREYIGFLVEKRFHLEWYIEGGRSRTGKLLPPRMGALAYVVDAYRQGRVEDVALIPASITYDHLKEASEFAGEAGGKAKKAEDAAWVLRYWRGMRDRYGRIYLRFGEPLSLRDALAQSGSGDDDDVVAVQKVAFEVAWRINQATPATGTALVTLTLLAAVDRALTLREVRTAVAVLLDFAHRHRMPLTGSARRLDTADGVQAALDALGHHGVVSRHDTDGDSLYWIGPGQHLVAAFYRNSIIHAFLDNAIIELALVTAGEPGTDDPVAAFWAAATALRDLLKFDFFFQDKERFAQALSAELAQHDADWQRRVARGPEGAAEVLRAFRFPVAPATLRPFVEAYLVVAMALARDRTTPAEFDRRSFLASCTTFGKRLLLQKVIERPEAVSSQLFGPALELAENRGLLAQAEDLPARRAALVAETRDLLGRIDVIEQIAARNFRELMTGPPG